MPFNHNKDTSDLLTPEVKDYLDQLPVTRRNRLESIHDLIMDLYPRAAVTMKYKMPTYEFESGYISLASQKHYISLYTCGAHHLESFKQQHPAIKTGKGCINFRDTDKIPLKDLKPVIHSAMSEKPH